MNLSIFLEQQAIYKKDLNFNIIRAAAPLLPS